MATRLSVAVRNAMANAITAQIDGGTGAGTVNLYTGTQPATVATAATGTLLATVTLSDPSFGAAANGTITNNAVAEDTSADASGTAGWFRVFDSAGTAIIDGAVPGEMSISPSAALVAGGVFDITTGGWTITIPAG